MPSVSGLLTRLRRAFERDMAAEMRTHIERETARRIAAGEDPAIARRRAAAAFGSVDARVEEVRDRRLGNRIEDFVQAIRFALRRLRRTPAFTVTALALCIGANLAIFTVVDVLVLRPLPFSEPERLVTVINSYPGAGHPRAGPSIPNYFARREAIDALANVALFDPVGGVIGETGSMRKVDGARVTPEFFATLGVPLTMGRMWGEDKFTYQTSGVIVLTHEFWQSHFGAAPDILGRTLIVDGVPASIIGVLPPRFRFLASKAQFFKPLAFNPPERAPTNRHNSLPGMIMIG
ncbi:MAG: ABC transporter permease [Candidatus Synoicihabitans palmerolidicus]|nr:ABC transporter permease [Candidatus Synoicihabitans palmerolidicus]